MARVVVDVMPKPEILDVQGQGVSRALGRIGVSGISGVRQGVDDATLHRLAGSLLANPVIEDWTVTRL